MLNFALNITVLALDAPFYYKYRPRIDEVAFIFQIGSESWHVSPFLSTWFEWTQIDRP